MIYELRTYTLKAGTAPSVAKNAGTIGREIRGDDYGKLEGYWVTEIGPLNQVMHLWRYESLEERQRLRAELAKNERWANEYLAVTRPSLVRQDIRLMNPILPFKPPAGDGNIYEYRAYRAFPGRAKVWADAFTEIMPVREKYGEIVCAWITEAGQPNEVSHLVAYSSLDARMEIRAKVGADADWQAFLKESSVFLDEMQSTVMRPADHSPLK